MVRNYPHIPGIDFAGTVEASSDDRYKAGDKVVLTGWRVGEAADVDGDGDMDVLSASQNDDEIAWYENTDGAGSFGPQQVISNLANGASSVFAADVDGDGDMDVFSASFGDDEIVWHRRSMGGARR